MVKKSNKKRPAASYHTYRHGQRPSQWLVPLQAGGYACIYHGHEDAADHSQCGPQLFCCYKAATHFLEHYPDTFPDTMTLTPMEPDALLSWLSPSGPRVFYFYFCDPLNRHRVYFQGFSEPLLCPVLRFERPLATLIVNSIVVV